MTWLGVIFVAQEFPLTRFFPPDTHDWSMFIKPDELVELRLRNTELLTVRSEECLAW